MMTALENHVWQSTLFAAAAGLMTLLLRKNRAQTRYWLWLAASLKFLIPFSLLVSLGGQLGWRTTLAQPLSEVALTVEAITQQVATPVSSVPFVAPRPAGDLMIELLFALWASGFVTVLAVWGVRWIRMYAAMKRATPLTGGPEAEALRMLQLRLGVRSRIELVRCVDRMEPGVFGFRRPVLFLPAGICEHLAPEQLNAILAHELCHVRFRHTIVAATHSLVEAIFWFHPLVWWLGTRLTAERERACDEEVLRLGNEPQAYAEGILTVCRLYLASPMAAVPGVASSNLRARIEEIMSGRVQRGLSVSKKLMLALAGAASIVGPVAIGIVNSPRVRAQEASQKLNFEVASMRYAPLPPGGVSVTREGGPGTNDPERLTYRNVPLKSILLNAYGFKDFQISGPGWIDTERYDINANIPPGTTKDQFNVMMQNLVTERLQMKVHHETKDFSAYALVVGKNGLKMKASDMNAAPPPPVEDGKALRSQYKGGTDGFPQLPPGRTNYVGSLSYGHSRYTFVMVSLPGLATLLENQIGRPVADETGLTGKYDFRLDFSSDGLMGAMALAGARRQVPGPNDDPSDVGPIIFQAVQDQLGLKLEEKKVPFDVLVIDRLEKMPIEN